MMRTIIPIIHSAMVLALILAATPLGSADQPRRVAAIYEVRVYAVFIDESGAQREEPLTGLLTYRFPASLDEPLDVTLDVAMPPEAWLVRVKRDDLPLEVQQALGGAAAISYLNAAYGGQRSSSHSDQRTVSVKLRPPIQDATGTEAPATRLTVVDAHGRPAAGFSLELKGKLQHPTQQTEVPFIFASGTLDAKGSIDVNYPLHSPTNRPPATLAEAFGATGAVAPPPVNKVDWLSVKDMVLTIVTPDGNTVISPFVAYERTGGNMGNWRIFNSHQTILLSQKSVEAVESSGQTHSNFLRGEVVYEDETPAEGALIQIFSVTAPRMNVHLGGLPITTGPYTVRLGPSGRFALGITPALLRSETPPETFVLPEDVVIEIFTVPPDASRSYNPIRTNMKPGDFQRIVLPALPVDQRVVRMMFLDENNETMFASLDRSKLPFYEVVLRPVDETSGLPYADPENLQLLKRHIYSWNNGVFEIEPIPLPGTYRLDVGQWAETLLFEPQRLTAERIEAEGVIMWKPAAGHYIYRGRAIDASTGAPVAGAYVTLGGRAPILYQLTPEQRDFLWRDVPPNGRSVPLTSNRFTLNNIDFYCYALAIARTGPNGEFEMHHPAGRDFQDIQVWAPGYMMRMANWWQGWQGEGATREIHLPDAPLIPAATITFTATAPVEINETYLNKVPDVQREYLSLNWMVEHSQLPEWKLAAEEPVRSRVQYPSQRDTPWTLVYQQPSVKIDAERTILVPAGVSLKLTVNAGPSAPWFGPAVWADIGPLAPGEHRRLETRPLVVNKPYTVQVKQSDGSPAAGFQVQGDGLEWAYVNLTDANGEIHGWCNGSIQFFKVFNKTGYKELLSRENITFDPKDEEWRLVLTLPEEQE